ncbi:MAG: hypothetical protein KDK62_01190 [Chlamydiia bacterium]|nr:hypothetical protein [Chlamydiia bacterium]
MEPITFTTAASRMPDEIPYSLAPTSLSERSYLNMIPADIRRLLVNYIAGKALVVNQSGQLDSGMVRDITDNDLRNIEGLNAGVKVPYLLCVKNLIKGLAKVNVSSASLKYFPARITRVERQRRDNIEVKTDVSYCLDNRLRITNTHFRVPTGSSESIDRGVLKSTYGYYQSSGGDIHDFCFVSKDIICVATTFDLKFVDVSDPINPMELHRLDFQFQHLLWDEISQSLTGQKADGTNHVLNFGSDHASPLPKATLTSHVAAKVGFIATSVLKALFVDGLIEALEIEAGLLKLLSPGIVLLGLFTLIGGGCIGITLISATALPILAALSLQIALGLLGTTFVLGGFFIAVQIIVPPICGAYEAGRMIRKNVYQKHVFI